MAKLAVALLVTLAIVGSALAAPKPKVTYSLQKKVNEGQLANIVISLREDIHPILNSITGRRFANRAEKVTQLAAELQAHAQLTQAPILAALASFPFIGIKSFWVSNQVFVSGANSALVARMASMPEVAQIHEEHIIELDEPINYVLDEESSAAPMAEWGLNNINAPEAWALGHTGEGAVIATIDTGARGTHESLSANYLGTYGWFDPYQATAAPNDQNGHGSHTTANIAGRNNVGVAPSAKWQACKGCSTSSCTEVALTACAQWVVCPTWTDGSNPDCSKTPDVCSNSWGGGQGDAWYNDLVDAWIAADITPVFAIGNSGPNCGTANSPGDQLRIISVGASTASNGLALFSSKGPSVDGLLKPDISAPGENVRSASHTSDTAYASNSGTSMACPHVSGVVALVKAIVPDINHSELQQLLYNSSTKDLTPTVRNCGGVDTSTFPNHSYGHGKVNARNAVVAAEALRAARKA